MAPGISFGQFNIVGGSVREDGPYVGVIEDRTPAESLADLYLTLEPARSGSEQFCPDLLKLIAGQFGRPQYSLTGNLLQSLRAAQEHLRAWNKTAPRESQAAIGATCLAVSGDQVYLAQIGPGLAYLRHDGMLRRLEAIEPEARAPLGTSIGCSPEFHRFELAQGDTVLLVSSGFAQLIDEGTIDLILSLPPSDALPEIYKVARNQHDFSALYLAVTGTLRRTTLDSEEELHHPAVMPARGIRRGLNGPRMMAEGPVLDLDEDPPEPLAGSFPLAQPYRKQAGGWFMRRRELERLTDHHSLTLPRPALYTVAAILALALAGWWGVPHLLQAGRQDRFASLMQDARQQQTTAANAATSGQKRALLDRVQADLGEARMLRPQDPELANADASLSRALQALNQVRPLPSPGTIIDLTSTPVAPRSVVDFVAASRLYLLDGSTGRVYSFDAKGQSPPAMPVFEAGMVVESIQTGQAVHLAVQAPGRGQPGLLYILDSNRRLFTIDDSGTLRAVGLTGANSWKTATAIAVSGGDLYVLDSGGNQVWRFAGGDAGFTTPPVPLLSKGADLHDAAEISVAGDVYVGTVNGQLLRLRNGRQESVTLNGIDHPLTSPQPPIVDASSGLEMVADPGNQRIVVADSSSTFQYQYAGAELQGLRSISVDPASGVLYALSGQKIISAQLH